MMKEKKLMPVKRALVSVSDKSGLIPLANTLQNLKIEILSTGGTKDYLLNESIKVKDVSEYTKFPEMMDGRIKTLHPKVHGGILARRGKDDDAIKRHEIDTIDLVIVNLYPFEETIKK
ncbi:MAG: bifunctional phosphoribosylaminoimidazolecarboxamide formyltransferase/IMP cyclohydrolase, partial [Halieaceae bacterium]|nr:bifunctional phosphoribosylaminoimidazolecarboxamide formyltransferase/IMP cyclohydrolase [Halieaceae bacterium]